MALFNRTARFAPARHARAITLLPLALLCSVFALTPASVVAQSSGSGGSAGSSGSGGGTGTSTGAGSSATGDAVTSPSTRSPATGPQSRSPAMAPSPIPQRDTGVPPVPSAGNAEPNSPIYRRDPPPGALDAQRDLETTTPETDAPLGGSGGAGSAGTANSGDPLIPTDPSGNPADSGPGRMTNSIGEEPDRIKRGGGAAGANLEECMKLWDPSTHMTKERWKVTCERLGR
ncbi:hypothetical protein [Hyphomicrobium sp.]|uniref:hypothetical protein n=1 Tax=Hyphomicrobium sp. TaxID=82 RepID=UPI0025C2B0C2|nr:hypothetical protein [Hyphomicrobium sp.]MCC7251812.1 hypothetical protein [Hyphomicrobium sp.]